MINSNITKNPEMVEYGSYVEITNDNRFPAISVSTNPSYFAPEIMVQPKHAVLTYMINASDINVSLSSSGLNIGDVGIIDHSSGVPVYANIVAMSTVTSISGITTVGAMRVLTQDFDSIHNLEC